MVRVFVELPDDEELKGFLDEFQGETDRAAAVLGAAYLDALLENLLRGAFLEEGRIAKDLFGPLGPLGGFSGKISISRVIGLISLPEARDLQRVKKIRNQFAHRIHGLSFDEQELRDICGQFECNEERFGASEDLAAEYPREPRQLFDLATALLAFYMRRRLKHVKEFPETVPPLWLPESSPEDGEPSQSSPAG